MIFKQNKTKDKGFGGQKKLKINYLFLNKKKDQPLPILPNFTNFANSDFLNIYNPIKLDYIKVEKSLKGIQTSLNELNNINLSNLSESQLKHKQYLVLAKANLLQQKLKLKQELNNLEKDYLISQKQKVSLDSSDQGESKKLTTSYNNSYYMAFDIETINLEVSVEEELEVQNELGEPTPEQVILSLSNQKSKGLKRIIQIPVLIGFTTLVKKEDREEWEQKSDSERTKTFEIEDLDGSSIDIIKKSDMMMLSFWPLCGRELALYC